MLNNQRNFLLLQKKDAYTKIWQKHIFQVSRIFETIKLHRKSLNVHVVTLYTWKIAQFQDKNPKKIFLIFLMSRFFGAKSRFYRVPSPFYRGTKYKNNCHKTHSIMRSGSEYYQKCSNVTFKLISMLFIEIVSFLRLHLIN